MLTKNHGLLLKGLFIMSSMLYASKLVEFFPLIYVSKS